MSVMTTVLGGTAVPVVRRPLRAVRPATPAPAPLVPARALVPTVVEPATAVVDAVVTSAQWRVVAPSAAERAWGVLAHLSGVLASVAGPLLVARLAGRRSDYVREQATAAANFQLAFLATLAPFALVGVVTLGLAALFVVPLVLAWLLTAVLAATAAADGERYRYPVRLTILR